MKHLKLFITVLICFLFLISCKNNEVFDISTSEKFEIQKEKTASQNIKSGKLANGWYQTTTNVICIERSHTKFSKPFVINPIPILFPQNCKKLQEVADSEKTEVVQILLDPRGAKVWARATQSNQGRHLVFILENTVVGATLVNSVVTGGVVTFNRADLTEKNIEKLKAMIKVGVE